MTAADTATTRDVYTAPTVEAAPAAAPTGGGTADVSTAQARGDEQALREQLGRLREERDDYLETLQRVQAEYDDDRRRAEREQAEQHERGGQALAMSLLPVLDAFDAARAHTPDVLAALARRPARRAARRRPWTCRTNGSAVRPCRAARCRATAPPGRATDSGRRHRADGQPRGAVVVDEMLRPGYRWRKRLVRPAMVRVRTD